MNLLGALVVFIVIFAIGIGVINGWISNSDQRKIDRIYRDHEDKIKKKGETK